MALIHSIVIFGTECYLKFFLIVQSIINIWKGLALPYRISIYWLEMLLFITIILIQYGAIVLSKVNRPKLTPLLLTPTIMGLIYFIIWQQYVLRVDIITHSLFLAFQVFYILTSFAN